MERINRNFYGNIIEYTIEQVTFYHISNHLSMNVFSKTREYISDTSWLPVSRLLHRDLGVVINSKINDDLKKSFEDRFQHQ